MSVSAFVQVPVPVRHPLEAPVEIALASLPARPMVFAMTSRRPDFRSAHFGREKLEPALSIPRHRHRHGYAAVVLSGRYQEAGTAGRYDLGPGHVVLHQPFDAHLDHIHRTGAEVLNLPLPADGRLPAVFRISDPDLIARTAERDPQAAANALSVDGGASPLADWPDDLAQAVTNAPELALSSWAGVRGLAAETLSRGFRKAFGITPARFRVEIRAQKALHLVTATDAPLAAIAVDCGFADQPHLTRSIVTLTGRTPGFWRERSIRFKTGHRAAR